MVKKVLTSIWFLSFLIAVPIIIFMPLLFEKYKVEEVSREPIQKSFKNSLIYYADLDNDKTKEAIQIGELVLSNVEKIVVEFAQKAPVV